ncbi:MAG: glycosyltransferase family 39 protein [Actinobacteria bacterium]|nr:glycosyltransferase family 39 protein [Actinomycetota bacterium]MBU1943664.1 glycosyltransferase family 39 protein [Actinomycetota bacterium]MBU2686192.1 glycosyltransferase family 39 protein [Actinomycetota bacterium]
MTESPSFLRRNYVWILLGAVFTLYLVTRLVSLKSLPVFCDESIYIRWSQLALYKGNYLISLTDGKPPLHAWAMVPLLKVFADPLVAGRITSVIAGAFSTLGMVLIGRELKDLELGAWAGLLYVLCPFALWYDRMAVAEGLLLTFFIFAVFFALKAVREVNHWWLIGTGVSIGLAMLTKPSGQLLYLVIPFAYLVRGPREKGRSKNRPLARWALGVVGSFVIGWGMYNVLQLSDNFVLIDQLGTRWTYDLYQVIDAPMKVFPANSAALIRILFVYLIPTLFLACIAGLLLGVIRRWRPGYFLVAWALIIGGATCFVAGYHFPRYFIVVIPPLLLGGAYLVRSLTGWAFEPGPGSGRGKLVAVLGLVLVLLLVLVPVGVEDAFMVVKPERAWLPYEETPQFITGWAAGWGIDETVRFLEEQSEKGTIAMGRIGYGCGEAALSMYVFDNEEIRFLPGIPEDSEFPPLYQEAARAYPTYAVINGYEEVPAGWPVDVIAVYPKDGNEKMNMFLVKIRPGP